MSDTPNPDVTKFVIVPNSIEQEINNNTSIIQNLFRMFGLQAESQTSIGESILEETPCEDTPKEDTPKEEEPTKEETPKEEYTNVSESDSDTDSDTDSEDADSEDADSNVEESDTEEEDCNEQEERDTDIFLIGTTHSTIQYESSFTKANEVIEHIIQRFLFDNSMVFRIDKKKYKYTIFERDPYYLINPYYEKIVFMGEIIRVSKSVEEK